MPVQTDAQGHFSIAPVYKWHYGKLYSPLIYSLFPFADIIEPPKTLTISAPGYSTYTKKFSNPHQPEGGDIPLKKRL